MALEKKISYDKWKKKKKNTTNNNVFNPSKSFLDLKKSTLEFCWLLKDRSLKKKRNWKHTELTHFPLAKRWISLNGPR